MRRIGFSTGAIARGDFRSALAMMHRHELAVVELSALRVCELRPLVEAIPDLDLTGFSFVSIHAPSKFGWEEEDGVLGLLRPLADRGFPIVVHPDTISTTANGGYWATDCSLRIWTRENQSGGRLRNLRSSLWLCRKLVFASTSGTPGKLIQA